MMQLKTFSGCLLAALLASTSVALADDIAIVSKVGGKNVTWQHGDASAAPRVQTLLGAGDSITAGKGSFVEINYLADNCTIRVNSGGNMVIGDASPCSAAAQQKADAAKAGDAKLIPAAVAPAEVMDAKGPVTRVNKGDGMVSASVGDSLKPGDEVFAGKNSSVSLYFASAQCSYTVASSSVYKVTDKAPCKASTANVVPTADVPSEIDPVPLVPPLAILGLGAVVVGGAAAVIIVNENDPSNDNSPATLD